MPPSDADTALRRDLDRCVKCGLCLPECPTYRLAADESESPRGRLALIEGLVDGRLHPDAALQRHLDSCLGCRRCERVCPSQVPYGRLIDVGRTRLPGGARRRLARLLQRPSWQHIAVALGRSLPLSMSRPFERLHHLHQLAHALPAGDCPPAADVYASTGGSARGCVGVFAGCTGAALQPGALTAACRLIRRAGFDVVFPAVTTCCGALAAHAGDADGAASAAAHTRAALDDGLDTLVSLVSGCGIHLDAYDPPLRQGHRDVCRFLMEQGRFVSTDFAPLHARVALHVPCSVENVYRGAHWARALLQLVPGIELSEIGEPGQCCGAAGDHMLRNPERAGQLRRPLLETLAAGSADFLVTSNVGCALHLAVGLGGQGSAIEVLHPIELLARQLR